MNKKIENVFCLMAEIGIEELSLNIDNQNGICCVKRPGLEKHEYITDVVDMIMESREDYIWREEGYGSDDDLEIDSVEATFTLSNNTVAIKTFYSIKRWHLQEIPEDNN